MENRPIPALGEFALAEGWQGPVTDPVLPGADPGPILSAAGLPASAVRAAVLAGLAAHPSHEVSPAWLAGSLTLILHAQLDPVRRIRFRAGVMAESACTRSGGLRVPAADVRLSDCYRRETSGTVIVVGNSYATIAGGLQGPYGRTPAADSVGSGFCARSLGRYYPFPLQIVPKGKSLRGVGRGSGYPGLDARYLIISPQPGAMLRSALRLWPPGSEIPDMNALIGDELAAFVTSRDGWAFAVAESMLVCAVLEVIRSGEQARQLVADAATAARLLGR